jgi:hypothetical protein
MRFQVPTAVRMMIMLFWVLTQYRFTGRYQCFGGTLALKMETVPFPKTLIYT